MASVFSARGSRTWVLSRTRTPSLREVGLDRTLSTKRKAPRRRSITRRRRDSVEHERRQAQARPWIQALEAVLFQYQLVVGINSTERGNNRYNLALSIEDRTTR